MTAPPASVARGAAWVAVLVCLCVGGAQLVALWPAAMVPARVPVAMPVCQAPVEVVRHGQSVLACATDATWRACTPQPYDRLDLDDAAGCRRQPQQMRGTLRLAAAAPLNLNRVDAADLAALPGIGPAMAERIVQDRTRHGPYANLDALTRVRGIGPATLARLRPALRVDAEDRGADATLLTAATR